MNTMNLTRFGTYREAFAPRRRVHSTQYPMSDHRDLSNLVIRRSHIHAARIANLPRLMPPPRRFRLKRRNTNERALRAGIDRVVVLVTAEKHLRVAWLMASEGLPF